MTEMFGPLGYLGVKAPHPSDVIKAQRAPLASDWKYDIGTIWIDEVGLSSYQLINVVAHVANWQALGGGAVQVDSLIADTAVHAIPVAGDITIAGGTNIGTTAAGSTLTVNLDAAITLANSVTSPIYASAAAMAINPVGALTVTGGTSIDINAAAANNITIQMGDDIGANFVDFENSISATVASINSLGNLLANDIAVADITSTGDITGKSIEVTNTLISQFNSSPIMQSAVDTGAAPSGATGDTNLMVLQNGDVMEQFILGAGQTIIAPRMDAAGLKVSLDLTNNEGAEYNFGVLPISKHAYTVGTSPAVEFEVSLTVADVTGAGPILMGFRKQEANNASFAAYTDFATIGLDNAINPGTAIIESRLNSGAVVTTDTTDAWVDGATHILKVIVSAAGVVTYTIDGVAPTVTAAFTFDAGDIIMPFFHFLHDAAAPGEIHWSSMSVGLV